MANKHYLHWLAGILLGIAVSAPAPADWVNDWIAQKTVSGPSYSNVRGQSLMSFGGFNTRWNRGSGPTPLVSFQRPSFRVGCGGIDAKMGGFWFAGIDALVQKVQAIIQNAAAIMFKIALDTISQMLGGAAEWVNTQVEAINKIAADECSAARALVNKIDPGGAQIKATTHSLMDSLGLAELAQDLGASPDAAKEGQEMKNNDQSAVNQDAERANCPAEVQQLLPLNGQASIVKQALAKTNLSAWEDVVRGMVGDVLIQKNTNKGGDTFVAQHVSSCYDNKDLSFDNLLDGNVEKRPVDGGKCVADNGANRGLLFYVDNMMSTIATKYANNTQLTAAESAFLDQMPPGITYRLHTAAATQTVAAAVNSMTVVAASAYAYASLDDLYRVTRKAAQEYEQMLQHDQKSLAKCKIAAVTDINAALRDWTKAMYTRVTGLRQYYAMRIQEFNTGTQLTRDTLTAKANAEQRTKRRGPEQALKTNKQ